LVPAKNMDRKPLAWHLLAEERIRAAQAAGAFEQLPGLGKPIPGIDEPHDELWWVKQKMRLEQIQSLPPALLLRLDVERTLARLASIRHENDVRVEVEALNERIRKMSFAVSWGPPVDVQPLDVGEVLADWRHAKESGS
jgi:DnaJ homologue, subfamily C, member 28, conserved domain